MLSQVSQSMTIEAGGSYQNILMERNFFRDQYAKMAAETAKLRKLLSTLKDVTAHQVRLSRTYDTSIALLKVRQLHSYERNSIFFIICLSFSLLLPC
jgi:hypothetical protein